MVATLSTTSRRQGTGVKQFHIGLTPPRSMHKIQIGRVLNEDAIVVKIGGKYHALHLKGANKGSRHWNGLMANADLFDIVADAHLRGKTSPISAPRNSQYVSPVPNTPGYTLFGAGVTYASSLRERKLEALTGGVADREKAEKELGQITEYDKVYDPKKGPPEVFWKGFPAHATMDRLCVRVDSPNGHVRRRLLPEPEVAIFVGRDKRPVGYMSNSDSTACSIEEQGTLLLAQAKVYEGSTTIQRQVTLFNPKTVEKAENGMPIIDLSMTIMRDGQVMTQGETSTSKMVRPVHQIIEAIARLAPDARNGWEGGFFVSTGTGIIPQDFSLVGGDNVIIASPQLGKLIASVEEIDFPTGEIYTN